MDSFLAGFTALAGKALAALMAVYGNRFPTIMIARRNKKCKIIY